MELNEKEMDIVIYSLSFLRSSILGSAALITKELEKTEKDPEANIAEFAETLTALMIAFENLKKDCTEQAQ